MQPTYLPWLGYFDLMDQSNVFVFLDSVQFDKRSWQQRNRIKGPSGELPLTVPVLTKGRRSQRIYEAEIDLVSNFYEKHIKAIQLSYRKARFFEKYVDDITATLSQRHRYLAEMNIDLILWFSQTLGIQTEFIRSSTLSAQGNKAELLADICGLVKADRYLSPIGSKDYIDQNNPFTDKGIELCYHAYEHPSYEQLFGNFLPYLSVLDLLLNEGERSLSIIRSGRI